MFKRWDVKGVDRLTGKRRRLKVDADDEPTARKIAEEKGVSPSKIQITPVQLDRWIVKGVDGTTGRRRSLTVKAEDMSHAEEIAHARGLALDGLWARRIENFDAAFLASVATRSTPAPEPDRSGVVYLLQCDLHFKIGKSVNGPRRYNELKIQLHERPVLVHEIRTNDIDYCERHWHRRFAALRRNGEWFKLGDEDVEEFKRCESMVAKPPNQ